MSKREKTPAEIEHEFDSAEVPSANIKAMRPFSELLEKKRMGRPPKDNPKVLVTSRYDADIIERFRAQGDGWQTRMNDALRTYLKEHPL
ncbi:hypothetical protein EOS_38120 [Caballeronia mineralivorans PML1(12)]|uniref:BrnA antitoxin of type II toxin-antitoxin system n=1 Tax=Caballeronia mineralivorans PML1(12) TaxID=908627 RepID=A0A0J1CK58_9BURK|nr:BrnA antitoxin family protein [Caballeronia mineralivorans]KLU21085.1 hypothetical protein EOS_38120 [Caballeronia mineralivorans PML1(12)]